VVLGGDHGDGVMEVFGLHGDFDVSG